MATDPHGARRLTKQEIEDLIKAHLNNIPNGQIAIQFTIDASTVRYHIARFKRGKWVSGEDYPLPSKTACIHPSLKCLVCGIAQNQIRRRELDTIRQLQAKLARANAILVAHDLITVE